MILAFMTLLSYNPVQVSCRGVPALPYVSRVAMIEIHLHHTTVNETGGFAAAASRRRGKP